MHVRSPGTDVFILLLDLAANGRLGTLTQLKFCTGVAVKYREIDVQECVQGIGQHKAHGLILIMPTQLLWLFEKIPVLFCIYRATT